MLELDHIAQHLGMEIGHSCRTSQILSHLVGPVWTTPLSLQCAVDRHPIPARLFWDSEFCW
jgi:hypothetical protein